MHKMEMRVKESGEQEEELVVSNTRPFSLKVGVHDANDRPLLDFSLPLRATLLYENGLPVKQATPAATRQTQPVAPRCITHGIRAPGPIPDPRRPLVQTSSSEPLLVGETDVVALRGTATFRLRITSLSSHRDKRRFRIQARPPRATPRVVPSRHPEPSAHLSLCRWRRKITSSSGRSLCSRA